MNNTEPLKVGELKPCPICGDDGEKGFQDVTVMNGDRDKYRRVICRVCGCMVPEHNWNTRTEPSPAEVGSGDWHAPGLGEVHNADHSQMIFCTNGDDIADDDLAQRVCQALSQQSPARVEGEVVAAEWRRLAHQFDRQRMALKGTLAILKLALDADDEMPDGQTMHDFIDAALNASPSTHPVSDDQQAKDAALFDALASRCWEFKVKYNRDNTPREIRAVFKDTVTASDGVKRQLAMIATALSTTKQEEV